jgi:hypothetical protein
VLMELLSDPLLRRRLGDAGRAWVAAEMNWDRTAEKIFAALA